MTKPYSPDLIERAAWAHINTGAVENGITLAYAHQHNFQGVPPYATISIDSRTPQGHPDKIHLDDTGVMALYGTRIGGGTIMCVGDTAGDMADRLVNWLTTTSATYAARRNGIVIHSAQPVPMMPEKLEGQVWQQMCAIDFQYRVGVIYEDSVGLIQIVNIQNRIDTIEGELWLSAYTPQPHPLPPQEYMTIDPFPPKPVGVYPPPHHTVHTNQGVKAYTYSTDNPEYVDIVTAPAQLRLKKAGAAMLTITAQLDDNTEVSAQTVIGCTG
jgi:hypothetical protein